MSFFFSFYRLLLFLIFFHIHLCAQTDLEDLAQDFVLSTKKIIIEDVPSAFNPSIVRWQGLLLMSFREIKHCCCISNCSSTAESNIGLVWLDNDFNPISKPQFISLDRPNKNGFPLLVEDARLITVADQLYVVYSGSQEGCSNKGFRMYIAQLGYDGKHFHVISNERLTIFEGEDKNKREKNWVPFSYQGHLLLAYGICPHKVLKPFLDGRQRCKAFATSFPSIVWEWGELRGGTPALPIDKTHYLAFFHSSKLASTIHSENQAIPHYFMGAYVFSAQPPFEIQQISPEPIIGKNFYHGPVYEPYWHPVRVIFPCGFTMDEKYIWISYGRQDHEIWIAKLDKQELLDSLIQVSTILE